MKREVLDVLRQQFRPEFLNRVDEIVVFHSLSREDLKAIVDNSARQAASTNWLSAYHAGPDGAGARLFRRYGLRP